MKASMAPPKMQGPTIMQRITVKVPATTANMGPGFDCLGMALDIWNTVSVEPGAPGMEITGEGADVLPSPRLTGIPLWQEIFASITGLPTCSNTRQPRAWQQLSQHRRRTYGRQ